MKRILINATHNEEVRVALCKGNHLYDFDLENRTREQKKSNIYKGHVTRVEPSLEAVFVEYGSKRQGFLPIREIASDYLAGNPREENIRKLIKEGDELIVQVEKEERGNKGAALSTYVSLAGRYLVLMPNNPKGGGISRQISGKLREDMKRMLRNLELPKGMSVIVRTAGIGKTQEDLQHDLNHLLNIWNAIQEQNKKYPSPRLVHQEAGVVTRAVRDYLRDDISEIWIDNEEAFIEAETFVKAVMPKQLGKLRKYTDFEPMFSSFGVERQIETAYQREVRLPSGGSIVLDQTEALVSIDINSAKSTKGADVSETAYHTNLEAADEIARQLRLRDMGGLIVIDFIDMNDSKHQKEVEKRLVDATKYDRARVQFGDISRFGLMEMSRQRLRPSLEESTGYICPRCHGNGMIRDLRSLSLSIMRQIEQTALKERHGEVQAEVPTDIAAFLLNEKRESLVYLEQDSGTRITILPHAHLDSPNFNLHFNHQGFAPSSYERVTDTQQQESSDRGYDVDWQTSEAERPEQQPTRQPRANIDSENVANTQTATNSRHVNANNTQQTNAQPVTPQAADQAPAPQATVSDVQPSAVAWLSNLFAPTPQAQKATTVSSADAAQAIEAIVNTGAQSRGVFGDISAPTVAPKASETTNTAPSTSENAPVSQEESDSSKEKERDRDKNRRKSRNNRGRNKYDRKNNRHKSDDERKDNGRKETEVSKSYETASKPDSKQDSRASQQDLPKREANSKRKSRGAIERGEAKLPTQSATDKTQNDTSSTKPSVAASSENAGKNDTENTTVQNPTEVNLRVNEAEPLLKEAEVVHISLDDKSNGTEDSKKEVKVDEQTKKAENASNSQQPSHEDGANQPTTATKPKSAEPTEDKRSSTAGDISAVSDVENSAIDTETETTDEADSDKSLSFDPTELFTDRYVAAKKFGQASNDPRLVKASVANTAAKTQVATINEDESASISDATPPATQAPQTNGAAIKGTVGEFIHNHLAQAAMRLAKDGVITCFLSALNAHKEIAGSTAKARKPKASQPAQPDVQTMNNFSFVNYGYDALSPRYLTQFAQMTSAVAAYNIEQGKTDVAPTVVTKRAANDPRGQHPAHIEEASLVGVDANQQEFSTEVDTAINSQESVKQVSDGQTSDNKGLDNSSATNITPAQAMSDLLALNVGSFVERVLGEEGLGMLESGQTETAFLRALSQPLEVLMSVATATLDTSDGTPTTDDNDSNDYPANALTNAAVVDDVTHESEALLEAHTDDSSSSEVDNNEADSNSEDNANNGNSNNNEVSNDSSDYIIQDESSADSVDTANKTSIETYKSMIETISEQLLPPTGLLKLSSVKVPKNRTRKSKEASKDDAKSNDANADEDS